MKETILRIFFHFLNAPVSQNLGRWRQVQWFDSLKGDARVTKHTEKEELHFPLLKSDSSVPRSAMAEASASSPTNSGKIALDHGKFFKYESIRIEWTKHFENHYFDEVHAVKGFFKTFHRTHKRFQFVVAELFDETTHLVVRADDYRGIKEELERRTKKSLPEVSHVSGVKIMEDRKSFLDFESHREFSMSLKNENDKIRQRYVLLNRISTSNICRPNLISWISKTYSSLIA